VTLRYVQTVPRIDGAYELVIPLVVGPRFEPGHGNDGAQSELRSESERAAQTLDAPRAGDEGGVPRWQLQDPPPLAGGAVAADSRAGFGRWELQQLPVYPPVSAMEIPDQIDPERVSLAIRINAGMPIAAVQSDTHAITKVQEDLQRQVITLASGRTIDNRDFVLRYTLAGEASQAGLLAYRDERGGFFSVLIEPPAIPAPATITPREMVFVLDCSGSMSGLPMAASKAFMGQALRGLRATDSFRLIRFSDGATEFSTQPLRATPANIRRGIAYTNQLYGSGGTMMTSGIRQAFQPPVPPNALRLVVFLTDGYIGNEAEVLGLIKQQIGPARLFAFGVGAGVNRYLLAEMGRVGRGFVRYMDSSEDPEAVAVELAERLQSPVLTDIRIDWGDLAPTAVSPDPVPDLFAGQSLRVQGRYASPGDYQIRVQGLANGRRAVLPLRVRLPEQSEGGEAVALIWARSAIDDAMHGLITPPALRADPVTDAELKQAITTLGLDFSLVTQWTAFVAVSEKIYNDAPQETPTRPVPLPQVQGVSQLAYGSSSPAPGAMPSGSGTFSGNAAPEPEALLGLVMITALFMWFMLRRVSRKPGYRA
jgi:Ca-activated chloride channel family protein